MTTLKMIFCFILSLGQIISPAFGYLSNNFGDGLYDDWYRSGEYSDEYGIILEKDPDKDFIILNFADIQLTDKETFEDYGKIAKATIDRLIKENKPDLITLTGDNAWSTLAYVDMINTIDSYGIPWAPVMGNHDGEGLPDEFFAAYYYTDADNCLFRFGPRNMGYGNYIINISENGEIIHTLFMMDTHSGADYGDGISGYDHLWENQIDWYKWAVSGSKKLHGKTIESTVIMHIPVYEYNYAWQEASYDKKTGKYTNPDYAATSFGVNNEYICSAPVNNGFFDVCKELGSTKNMLVGHDHTNCSSIVYKGIRLTYGVKTGPGCYWNSEINGGTVLSINSDGNCTVSHRFIDADTLNY